MLGSNYTFLAKLNYGGQKIPAVYKPQQGEQPLWDFPENSLAGREVAAYYVSEMLAWSLVPYTTFRHDGPYGPGSLQQYIEYDPDYHYFNFTPQDRQALRPVALFDLITNNADRKGSHIFFEQGTHHLYAIDHGLCFHEENKLRTVVWDFAGDAIPAKLLSSVEHLHDCFKQPVGLFSDLAAYLSPTELTALNARARTLIATQKFPYPPERRRAYPYPPL